jgi:hypothetical protein
MQKGALALLLFLPVLLYGQSYSYFIVVDAQKETGIPYAKTISSPVIYSDNNGLLRYPNKNEKGNIAITAWQYDTISVSISPFVSDTIVIKLTYQPDSLEEISVISAAPWIRKYVLKGFEKWDDGWLFLTKNEVLITDENLDIIYKSELPKLDKQQIKSLEKDCLGNLFLSYEKDFVQIFITDSTIYTYPKITSAEYEHNLKNLLGKNKKFAIQRTSKENSFEMELLFRQTATVQSFAVNHPYLHNCGMTIKAVSKDTSFIAYNSLDSNRYTLANQQFNTYLGNYLSYWKLIADSGIISDFHKHQYLAARGKYKIHNGKYIRSYLINKDKDNYIIDPFTTKIISLDDELNIHGYQI